MAKTSRNEPCPCGSGKKYKACHGTTDKSRSGLASSRILAIVVGIVILGGGAIAVNHFRTADLEGGAAYVYDAENDRYWDPTHSHWHDGRPPTEQGGIAPAAGTVTPQPWAYDAEKDQYYHPEHGHWHEGLPPTQQAAPPPLLPEIQGGTNVRQISAEEASRRLAAGEAQEIASEDVGLGPAAWEYDVDSDRHWNPTTKTWDQGMPPLEAFTSDDN